ncbi:tyrosine-type recombinase/integrase [Clostridium fermenticellae]|nr:site-specific integrase [Clostridium fermenticellae]
MINNIIFDRKKIEYYKKDIINLWEYPNFEIGKIFIRKRYQIKYSFDLSLIESNDLKNEIKTYIENCIINYDLHNRLNRMKLILPLSYLIGYLNSNKISSFKVINIQDINGYKKYLEDQNINIIINNRKTYIFKIIYRLIKSTIYQLPKEEQNDIFILCERNDIFSFHDEDMLFFCGLSDNIKKLLKSFFIHTLKLNLENSNFRSCYIRPLKFLIEYCIEFDIRNWDCIYSKEYEKYLLLKGHAIRRNKVKKRYANATIIDKINEYIDARSTDDFFKRDIWNLSELSLESNRINKILKVGSFNFTNIKNINNKNYAKQYIKYLITNTSLAISTIKDKVIKVKDVLSKTEKKFNLLSHDELLELINVKLESNEKLYETTRDIKLFNEYLCEQGIMRNVLLKEEEIKKPKRKHTYRTVEDFVVNQIFNILDRFPVDIMIIYLIIYCTGVRISEALTITSDCLYISNNDFYIKTISTKMKKEQDNTIPKNLYIILNAYIKGYCVSGKKEYIFKGKRDISEPMKYAYFKDHFSKEIKKYDIRCSNGELYNLDIHGYRHRLGTEMHQNKISCYIIQKVLHHESIEMTMAYIDIFEKDIKDSYTKFFDNKGRQLPPDSESEKMILSYLNHALNSQALPNGICGLPAKFNKCKHANICLTCSYFCTNRNHILTLKKQLKETEIILENAKKNNWKMQIATNKEVKENLESIIAAIEKGDNNKK